MASTYPGKEFYVYAHRTAAGRVFYVGKGLGRRAWERSGRNAYWRNTVKKNGGFEVEILIAGLQEWAALEFERGAIALIGRRDCGYGPLVNWTDGGEGVSGSLYTEERRAAIGDRARGEKNGNFGKRMSDEQRRKISNSKLGTRASEATKAKLSIARKGAGSYWFGKQRDPETAAKISASKKGKPLSEEHKLKIRMAAEKRIQDTTFRTKHSQAMVEWWGKRKRQNPAENRSSHQ